MIIAEVEGESSGQPEQKLYKSLGQMIMCVSQTKEVPGWKARFYIAVSGDAISKKMNQATALKKLDVIGVYIKNDQWFESWTTK